MLCIEALYQQTQTSVTDPVLKFQLKAKKLKAIAMM